MNRTDIARAICCPTGKCCWPDKCYAKAPGSVLVDIPRAVDAVVALFKGEVRAVYRGPPVQPLSGDAE
jgi:hypothetical protein